MLKKIPHIRLIIAIILSYMGIKLIDNYGYFLTLFESVFSILTPFIFACIIAYVLNAPMSFFEIKFKIKRKLSILITYSIIISLIVIFTNIVLPKLASNMVDLFENVPQFASESQIWINDTVSNSKILDTINTTGLLKNNLNSIVTKVSDMLVISLDTILTKTVSVTTSILNVVFGFIISIYILNDKELFVQTVKKFIYIILKKKNGDRVLNLFKNIHHMLCLYIGTKALDSLIIAIICFIGVSILKSPYALLISLIVGITNMIPYFGPFIGMIPATIINLFFSPIKALWVLIFLILLQQFDGWYLDPKLIGGKVGLSPFLIILAVTLGGGMFGVGGMLLGVPTMAVVKIYIDKILKNYVAQEQKNNS